MKKTICKILAFVVLCMALLTTQVMAAGIDVADFTPVGAASATQVNSGVKITGDWGAKVVFSKPVKLDGFSITLGEFALDKNFGSLCFVLSPNEGGVNLGATGDGFMIKIWNFGSTYMDAADTSIHGWNDLQVANGGTLKDGWLAAIVPDTSLTININKSSNGKYAVTNNLNPTNCDFMVDASIIEKAMNSNGEVYLTFYAWNTTSMANSMVVQNINGLPTGGNTNNTTAKPTTTKPTTTTTTTAKPTTTTTTEAAPTEGTTTTEAPVVEDTTTTTEADVAPTEDATTTTTVANADTNTDVNANNDTTKSGNPWLVPVIIVAIVLLAFCVVGGIIVYKRTHPKA